MIDAIYELRIWLPTVKAGEPRDARWEIERLDTGETRRGVHVDLEHYGQMDASALSDPPTATTRFSPGGDGHIAFGIGDVMITTDELGLTVASNDGSGTATITKVPLGASRGPGG